LVSSASLFEKKKRKEKKKGIRNVHALFPIRKNLSSRGLNDDDEGDDYNNQTESYSLSQNVTFVNVFALKCIWPNKSQETDS